MSFTVPTLQGGNAAPAPTAGAVPQPNAAAAPSQSLVPTPPSSSLSSSLCDYSSLLSSVQDAWSHSAHVDQLRRELTTHLQAMAIVEEKVTQTNKNKTKTNKHQRGTNKVREKIEDTRNTCSDAFYCCPSCSAFSRDLQVLWRAQYSIFCSLFSLLCHSLSLFAMLFSFSFLYSALLPPLVQLYRARILRSMA